jgi:hypothetical protein
MLELRDGRRVMIPLSLLRFVPSVEDVCIGETAMDHGDTTDPGPKSGSSSVPQWVGLWSEDDGDEDDVTVVWEDSA